MVWCFHLLRSLLAKNLGLPSLVPASQSEPCECAESDLRGTLSVPLRGGNVKRLVGNPGVSDRFTLSSGLTHTQGGNLRCLCACVAETRQSTAFFHLPPVCCSRPRTGKNRVQGYFLLEDLASSSGSVRLSLQKVSSNLLTSTTAIFNQCAARHFKICNT